MIRILRLLGGVLGAAGIWIAWSEHPNAKAPWWGLWSWGGYGFVELILLVVGLASLAWDRFRSGSGLGLAFLCALVVVSFGVPAGAGLFCAACTAWAPRRYWAWLAVIGAVAVAGIEWGAWGRLWPAALLLVLLALLGVVRAGQARSLWWLLAGPGMLPFVAAMLGGRSSDRSGVGAWYARGWPPSWMISLALVAWMFVFPSAAAGERIVQFLMRRGGGAPAQSLRGWPAGSYGQAIFVGDALSDRAWRLPIGAVRSGNKRDADWAWVSWEEAIQGFHQGWAVAAADDVSMLLRRADRPSARLRWPFAGPVNVDATFDEFRPDCARFGPVARCVAFAARVALLRGDRSEVRRLRPEMERAVRLGRPQRAEWAVLRDLYRFLGLHHHARRIDRRIRTLAEAMS